MPPYSIARYNAALAAFLGDLDANPAPNVCDQLTAAIVLESAPPELEALKGVGLAAGVTGRVNGVGVTSVVQFFNPADSTFIAVVELLQSLSSAVAGIGYSVVRTGVIAGSTQTGAGATVFLDGRVAGTPGLQLWTVQTGPGLLNAQGIIQFQAASQVGQWNPVRIPLTPGMTLRVFPVQIALDASQRVQSQQNATIWAHAVWRERQLTPTELQLGS